MASNPLMVEIREATEADAPEVIGLLLAQLREHAIALPEDALARAVRGVLGRPRRGRLVVATLGGRAVGVAALSYVWPLEHGGRSSWLEELYVEPEHRGRGIGTQLLHAACDIAARDGAAAVDLEVEAGHERAARLYEREGFRALPRARWVRRLAPATPKRTATPARTEGGCFCGALRYHADAPPTDIVNCHCSICRRTSGAPFVTWATFPADAFRFVAGTPAELRSTPQAVRTFCRACGTPITFVKNPDAVDVTVGSMDTPGDFPPLSETWVSSRVGWLALDADLPHHPGD